MVALQDRWLRELGIRTPWHPDPSISAYHGLTGAQFDFRAHPIAPAGTAILIFESPATRGTWAGHGVPGFYIGPSMSHYRSHHTYVTATRSPRVTDTFACFPETNVTPPLLDPREILIAAIKDFLHAIKKYDLTGELLPPTLVQDLQDLALNPVPDPAPASDSATDPVQEQRVLPLHTKDLQEPRVSSPALLQEQRVVTPGIVQEQRMLLPTLAAANPALTIPAAPIQILCPYPPPPGLPPLPDTDTANHLMDEPLTSPTVPIAPTRRTSRPHTIRAPSSFGYSVVNEDPSYFAILNEDLYNAFRAPTLTKSEVSDLLSSADAAWFGNIDHLAQANAAVLLNVNPDGSPLTFRTAKDGP